MQEFHSIRRLLELQDCFDQVFKGFYEGLFGLRHLRRYFKSRGRIKALVENQKRFLLRSLQTEPQTFKVLYGGLAQRHIRIGLPFVDFMEALERLEEQFLRVLLQRGILGSYFDPLALFFHLVRQYVARGYLQHLAVEVEELLEKQLKESPLPTQACIDIGSFFGPLKEGLAPPPPRRLRSCPLHDWLQGPEAQVLCVHQGCLQGLRHLHQEMHALLEALVYYVSEELYHQAYLTLGQMPQSFLSFMVQLSSLQSRLRERPGQALRNLLQTATKDDLVVAFTIRRPSASARAAQRQEALQSAQRALRRALRGKEHVLLPLKEQSLVALAKATPLQRTRLLKLKRAVEAQKVNDMPLQVSVCASQGEGALQEVFEHMLDSPEELRLLGPQELQALRAQVKEATKREAFLKQALRAQQVETFFQPVVGLATGSLYALEALARIKHNPRYLPAGEFIEALYRLDLVRELDRQVTQRTTEFAPLLNTVTARVSINLSPLSLKAPGFGRFLEQAIKTMKEQGIVPLVEITEQVVLEHMELIRHLNFHYGVRVAVDDFGTGYSSLKVVAELAQAEVISHLKIDGSLTTQVLSSEEAYKIVRSTVKMAKSLGLRTVAEYVESRPLAEKLLELEVDYGQGYYFAPPLSVSELMERYAGPPLARA